MPSHYNKSPMRNTRNNARPRRADRRVSQTSSGTSAPMMGASMSQPNFIKPYMPVFQNSISLGEIRKKAAGQEDQVFMPFCVGANWDHECCWDDNGNPFGDRRFTATYLCPNGQIAHEDGGRIQMSEMPGMKGGAFKLSELGNQDDQVMYPYCGNSINLENDPCCTNENGAHWGSRRFVADTLCMNGQYPMEAGGSVKRTRAVGGSMGTPNPCPPGMHMMPDGSCMEGEYHGAPNGNGYRRGGRTKPKPVRKRAVGGSMGMGNNETMSPGSSCIGECRYSATGGSFDFISRPCPSNCECPPTEQNLPLVSGCRSAGGRGMVQREGGRARRRFNTGGHAHIPQGGMGAPNHQHSIWNHVNEFHRNDAAYDSTNQTQHLSGHVSQAQQDNWYGQGEGSPANNQRRMNRMDRMKKGGRARRRFNTGGAPKMHYGGNTACRMITSKYDCVAPCKWDFNDGHCH